jgi:hypothetical protein
VRQLIWGVFWTMKYCRASISINFLPSVML